MTRPPMPTAAALDRMAALVPPRRARPRPLEHIGYQLLHGKWWQRVPAVVDVNEQTGIVRYELREPTPWFTGGVRWRFRCTTCRYFVTGPLVGACPACGGEEFRVERRAGADDSYTWRPGGRA